jgi:hypothetical protein
LDDSISTWGVTQREWLVTQLRDYRDRGLVLIVNGTTVRNRRISWETSWINARDSLGLYFAAERNYVLRKARGFGFGSGAPRLAFLTGDDHYNVVWQQDAYEPTRVDVGTGQTSGIGIPHREFKVISGPSPTVAPGYSGDPDHMLFFWEGVNHDCFARWDITSTESGKFVTARITYVHVSGTQDPPGAMSTPTDDYGNTADWYYENGHMQSYDADSTMQAQKYPPDNMPGPVRFKRGFLDDVHGTYHPINRISRDYLNRRRRISDHDELDNAEIRARMDFRREKPEKVP